MPTRTKTKDNPKPLKGGLGDSLKKVTGKKTVAVKEEAKKEDTPKKKTTKKKVKGGKSSPETREVLYPEVTVSRCLEDKGINAGIAQQLLGWTEESDNVKFGTDYAIRDSNKRKVRLLNNVTNRPIYRSTIDTLVQEILRRKWKFNGETIIIGKTGLVLNGQHQLIAVVLAYQEWKEYGGKWKEYWQTEPRIDKIVIKGIEEDDDTVNTMDTCKPRSLADVVYRSVYFRDKPAAARKAVSRMMDFAVRLLWQRTGAALSAYSPRRTHAEALDFISRHPKVVEAVKLIEEANGGGKTQNVQRYLAPGNAAGLLYLMGSAATDPDQGYSKAQQPSEEDINFDLWDKAADFWTLLAGGAAELNAVRTALGKIVEGGGGGIAERSAVLIKAWNAWSSGAKVTAATVRLKYAEDEDGMVWLDETPVVGGIDLSTAMEETDDTE